MDYEHAYWVLFRAITLAVEEIEKSRFVSPEMSRGVSRLKQAQQQTEQLYIEA